MPLPGCACNLSISYLDLLQMYWFPFIPTNPNSLFNTNKGLFTMVTLNLLMSSRVVPVEYKMPVCLLDKYLPSEPRIPTLPSSNHSNLK